MDAETLAGGGGGVVRSLAGFVLSCDEQCSEHGCSRVRLNAGS